jgi:hypothetical protein
MLGFMLIPSKAIWGKPRFCDGMSDGILISARWYIRFKTLEGWMALTDKIALLIH